MHFRQVFAGIPAFDNDVRVAIDRAGRVISVAGSPLAGLAVASTQPQLSGPQALARLQGNVGARRAVAARSGPAGVRRTTRFATGDFARLVLFGAASGPRLAWHVTYRAGPGAFYDAVVDATDGAILYRQNLVDDLAAAQVYPNHPGASAPVAVDLQSYGLNPGATVLDGTYARAWSDVDDDDEIGAGEEHPEQRGHGLRLSLHAVQLVRPGARPRLRRRHEAMRVGPGRPRLLADQPQAERRPGLLSREPLPRPPRRRRGLLHRRLGQLRGRRHRRRRPGQAEHRRRCRHRRRRRARRGPRQQREHVDAARRRAAAPCRCTSCRTRGPTHSTSAA